MYRVTVECATYNISIYMYNIIGLVVMLILKLFTMKLLST